jgi:hypothetical protein
MTKKTKETQCAFGFRLESTCLRILVAIPCSKLITIFPYTFFFQNSTLNILIFSFIEAQLVEGSM